MPSGKDSKGKGADAAASKKGDGKKAGDSKKGDAKEKKPAPKPLTPWQELRANVELLSKAVAESDDRALNKAVRTTTRVRRRLTIANLRRAVEGFIPNDARAGLTAMCDVLAEAETAAKASEDVDMGAGSGSGAGAGAGAGDGEAQPGAAAEGKEGKAAEPEKPMVASQLPEVHAFLSLLGINALFGYKLHNEALAAVVALVAHLKQFNRRTLDIFTAKAYAALSLAHEKLGSLESVRNELMKAHRTASLRHDEMGKATLLNLLLRNYLHYSLYEQANKLRLRATFPEAVSNNQLVRYLYYTGRIHAVRLDYSDAYASLLQATRKAPTGTALGFRCTVHRLMVVVQLLMGETPDRAVFREKGLRVALRPHFQLTQAVRVGDLALFNKVLQTNAAEFKRDASYALILRLRNNVIKAGLRKIAVAYSSISFADIATRLQLGSADDAAFLAAKAIKDGVIDAFLDHAHGALVSKETTDVYSTSEPQQAFHKRISFCLDVHNEAVKGMIYPPNAHRPQRDGKTKDEEDEVVDEEAIAAAVEEEEEDE